MPSIATAAPRPKGAPASSGVQRVQAQSPFDVPAIVIFYCFLAPNLLAALFAPIQDCDETFNYWEPTHYLRHGFGLQTWEYSPEYAIRSWLYIVLHAIVVRFGAFLPFVKKVNEFYFLRVVLAMICAGCQTRLFVTISKVFNRRVAIMFLLSMVLSPGMFHASVAYLPSSFAMFAAMLGFTSFMDWRGGLKTAQGIMWFGIAGVVGWPFAVALCLPFLLEELALAVISRDGFLTAAWRWLDGVVRSLIALALQFAVDIFFYHNAELVPFNIVKYNLFGGSSKGPNIFGTEPWHFYFRNLLLNFNVWFILALLALPLMILKSSSSRALSNQSRLRGFVFVSPFYLWLFIFTLQAHKEERFMYPAYPALALNAAISLHLMLSTFGSADPKKLVGRIPPNVKLAIVGGVGSMVIAAGALRTLGMVTAYSAPFRVHRALQHPSMATTNANICYGKEWYRFPSSFFLPRNFRAKFVKSAFDGLLPGEFSEAKTGFGFWPTWLVPSGMNDENQEDFSKYTSINHCTFLVDSYFPPLDAGESGTSSDLEPAYILDEKTWERVSCHPFLDAANTGLVGRVLWVPDWEVIPARFRRRWGQYCLLRRR